jgi:hypothetical protein
MGHNNLLLSLDAAGLTSGQLSPKGNTCTRTCENCRFALDSHFHAQTQPGNRALMPVRTNWPRSCRK